MGRLIDWYKRYIDGFKGLLGISDYGVIWLSFFKYGICNSALIAVTARRPVMFYQASNRNWAWKTSSRFNGRE